MDIGIDKASETANNNAIDSAPYNRILLLEYKAARSLKKTHKAPSPQIIKFRATTQSISPLREAMGSRDLKRGGPLKSRKKRTTSYRLGLMFNDTCRLVRAK